MNKQTQEALKMAIGKLVLEKMTSGNDVPVSRCTITNVEIHALSKEALEQPAQEPYGWMFRYVFKSSDTCTDWKFTFNPVDPHPTIETMAVYTHPYQWQGLTDDEIRHCLYEFNTQDFIQFARAIEQALKDKNHG